VLVTGNRIGNERYKALKIRGYQGAVSCGLVLSGPQLTFVFPGPAWPERAVYQRDRVPGGLGCVLGCRPVRFCRFLNKWREERDVPRYRRLIDVEDVGPNILDDVLPKISAVTTSTSRRVSSCGRPASLFHGSSSSSATQY
jgi:hypothetical protein